MFFLLGGGAGGPEDEDSRREGPSRGPFGESRARPLARFMFCCLLNVFYCVYRFFDFVYLCLVYMLNYLYFLKVVVLF